MEFYDYHVCCAAKRLLDSGNVGLTVKSEIEYKKDNLSFLDKRALKRLHKRGLVSRVNSSLSVDIYDHINNQTKEKRDE